MRPVRPERALGALLTLAACVLSACSGGGAGSSASSCEPNCNPPAALLTEDDVRRVIAQAVGEASARGARAHVAVVDRVGNVLAVFRMNDARATVDVLSGRGVIGGLDGITGVIPAASAAIAKAVTGAYLSSGGNAFSTRTASQIVQQNFLPGESQTPSGPLYGVQFSQLSCSDVNRNATHGTVGPKRSPLGLSADPGGLPLYKNGALVGGIGVVADAVYGLDLDVIGRDEDLDELIAVAGSSGFAAPPDIRGERITADGKTFRFIDSESIASDPARAPAFASLPGSLVAVEGYTAGLVRSGVAFGTAASGYRSAAGSLAGVRAFTLVDGGNAERFAPRAGSGSGALTAVEVSRILEEALRVANRSRAQIRRPLGSPAEVTVSVVGVDGELLGLARTPDAPVFGTDVSAQKARGALLFSRADVLALLSPLPAAQYATPGAATSSFGRYASAFRSFVGEGGQLDGRTAFSTRAIGNLHRPTYPDGIERTPEGPLSTPLAQWSPFHVGFQLDLVYNALVRGVFNDTSEGCAGRQPPNAPAGSSDTGLPLARNGIQIFPGGVPIYRGPTLIGAIGVSGDGVDQDDMIAFLGLHNATQALSTGLANAPVARRADQLSPLGVRLRYVQCPQSPFNDSSEQNACAGL